jgi:hypothetical protein
MTDIKEGVEYLEVRWNDPKDYNIHFKRFRRMGALLEWVEEHPLKVVGLTTYCKKKEDK